jgi:hypothetical protein
VDEGAVSAVPWRLARSLKILLGQVNVLAPARSKASDGSIGDVAHAGRASDHNPTRDGVVCAMDITHDPPHGCDAGVLAERLIQSRDPRIKYVIWNRHIASSLIQPWEWRVYSGQNPHQKHVHVSVLPETADDERPWTLIHIQKEKS